MSGTRLDWLEEQLDRDDLSQSQRKKYEEEANKIADGLSIIQKKQVALKQELITLLKNKDVNGLVATYGADYISDYDIVIEGTDHVVYSHVSRDDQNGRWVCKSAQEAEDKRNQLLYWRLYNYHMRGQ